MIDTRYGSVEIQSAKATRSGFFSRFNALSFCAVLLTVSFVTLHRSSPDEFVSDQVEDSFESRSLPFPIESISELNDWEKKLLSVPDKKVIHHFLKEYASKPHSAGTLQDYKTALYTAKKFQEYGFETDIKEYYTLLSKPIYRQVSIVNPSNHARTLNLTESTVPNDMCTFAEESLPPFLAYSGSGNVTAPVVYVNYGQKADFDYLAHEKNIDLSGKIALVRYGHNFRGMKVKLAQDYGLSGMLIYSDPEDDGYFRGQVYPEGPWRPEQSFQRGSAQFNSIYGGDPLTPGYPATIDAPRLSIHNATNIPHILAQVISYHEAAYILEALEGDIAPNSWQGKLPTTYKLGVSSNETSNADDSKSFKYSSVIIHMELNIDNQVQPIWDVIGRMTGSALPQEEVILGNHRDAWVCGAVDPSSGSSILMELARSFHQLALSGWVPKRTLVLGSWDGEEYGLLGSTEYVEEFRDELMSNAVAYINVDHSKGNEIFGECSPAISEFLIQTSKHVLPNVDSDDSSHSVADSNGSSLYRNLFDQWIDQYKYKHAFRNEFNGVESPVHPTNILGSGSDYTPFYQHAGIISAHLGFNKTTYGVYHSSMDSIMYVDMFGDPLMKGSLRLAQLWGLVGLKLLDLEILPFNYNTYSYVLQHYVADIQNKTSSTFPKLNWYNLLVSIAEYDSAAANFHTELDLFRNKDARGSIEEFKELEYYNNKLKHGEKQFLSAKGLDYRPWFKHLIFGPEYYEGYSATFFPSLSDAMLFDSDKQKIQAEIDKLGETIHEAAKYFES